MQPAVSAAHEHVGRAVAGGQRGGKDGVVLGVLDGVLNHFDVRVGGFEVRDYGVIECRVFGTPGPEGNFGHFLSQCGDRQHAHQQAQGNTNAKKLFHVEGLSFRFLWSSWFLFMVMLALSHSISNLHGFVNRFLNYLKLISYDMFCKRNIMWFINRILDKNK